MSVLPMRGFLVVARNPNTYYNNQVPTLGIWAVPIPFPQGTPPCCPRAEKGVCLWDKLLELAMLSHVNYRTFMIPLDISTLPFSFLFPPGIACSCGAGGCSVVGWC